jgi:hypothetical protein
MGARGPGSLGRRWCNPCSGEFKEMVSGPDPDLPDDQLKAKHIQIRRHWRNGGEQAVMETWNKLGWRPTGFWICFRDRKALRAAEKVCRSETEVVLMLGLADEKERSGSRMKV